MRTKFEGPAGERSLALLLVLGLAGCSGGNDVAAPDTTDLTDEFAFDVPADPGSDDPGAFDDWDPGPGPDPSPDTRTEIQDMSDLADEAAQDVPPEIVQIDYDWPDAPWFLCTGDDKPEGTTVVTAFELADQYFKGENLRTIEAEVDFPETGEWSAIGMIIQLDCPADGDCDNWDRFADISLVEGTGTDDEEVFVLERYITPYNVGMCMVTDVTRFAPRLKGKKTIRSFIDTWVGPEEPVHGHGWRTTIRFVFFPGDTPDTMPSEISNVWSYLDVEVGNPDNPLTDQLPVRKVTIPAGATKVELRSIVTGHGQGNHLNCAEFCHLKQVVLVDGTAFTYDPWRDDCGENPIGPLQAGTWKFPRAGWCPGAYVLPQVFDVTDALIPGQESTFEYQVWDPGDSQYVNSCRPGAGDHFNQCDGCAFDQNPGNCDYDGGMHTSPRDRITVQMIIWQ